MNVKYVFSRKDKLEEPKKYSYSEFLGYDFLKAWSADRDLAVVEPSPPPAGTDGRLPMTGEAVRTAELLETLYGHLAESKTLGGEARSWLDKLVKKFEVTRHLHPDYDEIFLAVDKTNIHDIRLYLRFAETCEQTYTNTYALIYLNALLKCIDTLTALRDRMDANQKARLSWLICQERGHVSELAEKNSLSL